MPAYEWKHVIGFGETSLVGNVYFSHYFAWQGHCRERFLHEHAPAVIAALSRREIAFFTRSAACDFIGDWGFSALDEVLLSMRLARFRGGRMTLEFHYARAAAPEEPVARGAQEVYCKAARNGAWIAEPFPAALAIALQRFAEGSELQAALTEAVQFHAEREKRAPDPR